jgi:hypothetical protein
MIVSLDFHRRGAPNFATSFAEASSYAKASADKTAVKKATNGRKVAKGRRAWVMLKFVIFPKA